MVQGKAEFASFVSWIFHEFETKSCVFDKFVL